MVCINRKLEIIISSAGGICSHASTFCGSSTNSPSGSTPEPWWENTYCIKVTKIMCLRGSLSYLKQPSSTCQKILKAFIYWVSHERAVKALLIGVMYFKAVRSSFWTTLQMLVVFKSAPILKRALKVKQAMMQLYVLKLLKIQTKYLGRQWRKSNMKTMSAIYQKVRHRLNDDWAYGNGKKHSVLIQKGSRLLVLGYK